MPFSIDVSQARTVSIVFLLLPIVLLLSCSNKDEDSMDPSDSYGRFEPETCDSTTGGDCFECRMPPHLPDVPDHLTEENLPWQDGRPFKDDAPINIPIEEEPDIHPDSDDMIAVLLEDEKEKGFFIAISKWTMPIYLADEGTQRTTIQLINDWGCGSSVADVPIPAWARPDPSNDGRFVILDIVKNQAVEIWQGCTDGESWSATWATIIKLDSDGIYPNGMSSRGSGFSLMGGMVWPQELANEEIDHALVFSTTFARSGGPVFPATETDGYIEGDVYLPEGARLQLNPDTDMSDWPLAEQIIGEALKKYGMYLVDIGGGIELQAVHTLSYKSSPYMPFGLEADADGVHIFEKLSIENFRVLDFGEQIPEWTDGRCEEDD